MGLWSVFVTGLLAGGASCAAVQGGLLVASVVRRGGTAFAGPPPRPPRASRSRSAHHRRQAAQARHRYYSALRDFQRQEPASVGGQLAPLAAFLSGKLVSYTLLGAALGAFGATVQPSFRVRAILQIVAGIFLLLLAAQLSGVRGLGWLVPAPPRFVRRLRASAPCGSRRAPGSPALPNPGPPGSGRARARARPERSSPPA